MSIPLFFELSAITIMMMAYSTGPIVFVLGCYHGVKNRFLRFFFGSGRRALITVEVMLLVASFLLVVAVIPDPSYFWQSYVWALPLLVLIPPIYAVLYIPFKIGPICCAVRDELLMARLQSLYNRGELSSDSLRMGLEAVCRNAERGNYKSARILERFKSRADNFGQAVRQTLILLGCSS